MSNLKMPTINYVIIAGNLTKDPTFRATTNGTPVANFFIASSRKFKDNSGQWREEVCYIGVVAWHKLAESVHDNLYKGSAVLVDGELQSRSLKSDSGQYRNIIEIKARRIQFLNKRPSSGVDYDDDYDYNDSDDDSYDVNESDGKDSADDGSDQDDKPSINFGYDKLKF